MDLVVDASILTESLRLEQSHVRAWITQLLDGDRMYVVAGLTLLEVSSALRKLVRSDIVTEEWAEQVNLRMIELPVTQLPVTQRMFRRIWELRHNVTPYDAAYVAMAEEKQLETRGQCALVTADAKLASSSGPVCQILLYPRDA